MLKSTLSTMLLLLAAASALAAEQSHDPAALGFVKGYTWGADSGRGRYAGPWAAESMKKLANTGTQWVCIAVGASMKTFDSTEILWGEANPNMVTDDEIRHAIDLARDNGMKVMLKPMVNCDDGTWRAWIKFYRPVTQSEQDQGKTGEVDPWQSKATKLEGQIKDLDRWNQWWDNYSAFILHYAKLAEEKHVPVLCLGCEMNSTEDFEDRWRKLIAEVRKVYSGLLTYDVNHDNEDKVHWWDAVDFISVSAYYPIRPLGGRPTQEAAQETTPAADIVAGLQGVKKRLAQISAKWHKPILFIETGVINARGFARYPWSHPDEHPESPIDEQEQANFYEAMCQVFWNEPWFIGFTWWDWPAQISDTATSSAGPATERRTFSVNGKKAEEVLRTWYAKPAPAK